MTQEFVTLPREIVEQAIYALYCTNSQEGSPAYNFELKAVKELRAALEQSQGEQAPVAWLWVNKQTGAKGVCFEIPTAFHPDYLWRHLYTHPQPAQKPLTDDQVLKAVRHLYQSDLPVGMGFSDDLDVARAIEAAHNIK